MILQALWRHQGKEGMMETLAAMMPQQAPHIDLKYPHFRLSMPGFVSARDRERFLQDADSARWLDRSTGLEGASKQKMPTSDDLDWFAGSGPLGRLELIVGGSASLAYNCSAAGMAAWRSDRTSRSVQANYLYIFSHKTKVSVF